MGLIGGSNDSSAGFEHGEKLSGGTGANLKRVVDDEAGVVIYAADTTSGYTMTAVPLSETDLETDTDQ